eukprot:CAMPEP_0174742642 /NCGR_PEP_ID=MMETSP1094-20130205/79485_1 /TAXON_ID=156173 /ORGANISM="Chrysochromulina brevifilum, Strain UTEX LB 985" /LENGTH=54 /DNA_ID=CAMNT_0015946727 /DNA_START=1 /DNA_END=165 /DNA_ORIENTATION=+
MAVRYEPLTPLLRSQHSEMSGAARMACAGRGGLGASSAASTLGQGPWAHAQAAA